MLVMIALVASTALYAGGSQDSSKSSAPMAKTDTMAPKTDPMSSGFDLTGVGPQVQAFTTEKAAMDLAATKTVVYFFAATWCPDCQATYRDLKANFAQLPDSLTVLIVNYDKYPELKTKFGIAMQHTWVKIDSKGEKAKSWAGSMKVADIVKNATSM